MRNLCVCACMRARTCVRACVRVMFACGAGFAAASSFMVKDKRMPLMNEIVDVLEAVTEDVEEWVVCTCALARVHMHRYMRAHIHACVLFDLCLRASMRCWLSL